jgi:hypothetical protein
MSIMPALSDPGASDLRRAMSGALPASADDVIDRKWCVEMLEARAREFQKQKLFPMARALSSIAAEISNH